jgi:hypothetical protein
MIDYQQLVREAHYGVVRQALRHGTRDDHYFYLTFRTDHPGVQLSKDLKSRFPTQITVVFQHMYYDLKVSDVSIGVTLSFNDVMQRVIIPFASLVTFSDPSVHMVLAFTPDMSANPPDEEPQEEIGNIVQFKGRKK